MKFIAYCYISFIHCVQLYYIVIIVLKYFHVIDLEMRLERCVVLVQTLINTICLLVKLRS